MAEFQLRLEFSWLVREFSSFKVFGFSLPPKISCSVLDFCTSTVPQEMECIFFNFFRKCFSKEHRLFIIEFFYAQRCLTFELALVSYSPANLMAGRSNGLLVAKQYCIFLVLVVARPWTSACSLLFFPCLWMSSLKPCSWYFVHFSCVCFFSTGHVPHRWCFFTSV